MSKLFGQCRAALCHDCIRPRNARSFGEYPQAAAGKTSFWEVSGQFRSDNDFARSQCLREPGLVEREGLCKQFAALRVQHGDDWLLQLPADCVGIAA